LSQRTQALLEPRKSPMQARSAASVDAILEATVQVLLDVGKERLTTTRVASRAGVSVGTLYQYFPNKSALLQAALKGHLGGLRRRWSKSARSRGGTPVQSMALGSISRPSGRN
jgi:AcrR family transcriptional regulator